MLEPRTLNQTPVPDPETVSPSVRNRLINLVDKRLHAEKIEARRIEHEMDEIIADLYQLTAEERKTVGME